MSFSQRLALFFALSLGLIWGYSKIFPPPLPVQAVAATGASGATGSTGSTASTGATGSSAGTTGSSAGATGVGASTGAPAPSGPAAAPTPTSVERHEARIANDRIALDLSNARRGALHDVETQNPQFEEPDGKGLDFLALGEEESLLVEFAPENTDFAWDLSEWEVDAESAEAGKAFALVRRSEHVQVNQRVEMGANDEAEWTVSVRNLSAAPQRHQLRVRARMGQGEEGNRYDIHRALCKTAEEVEDFDKTDLDEAPERVQGEIKWIGLDSKYFAQLVVSEDGFKLCEASMPTDASYLSIMGDLGAVTLTAGETRTYRFGLFLGAKEQKRMAKFATIEGAQIDQAIDWGWFGGLSRSIGGFMLSILRFFYGLTGVWGLAIILLTIVVKAAILPLSIKQYRGMATMKKLQPEIKKLQEKYKGDKTKLSQETMELYKRNGANPLSGCWPTLVQFPIWIALYAMLGTVVELYHESFLWLPDLTKSDPLYILPGLMGALMFVQMKIQPSAGDNEQAKMMQKIMPVVFVVMMLFLPSGLGIYIFANLVLSLIQSYIQMRPAAEASPAPAAS